MLGLITESPIRTMQFHLDPTGRQHDVLRPFTFQPNRLVSSPFPSDFDLSRLYGYTPVHSGWSVGQGLGQVEPSSRLANIDAFAKVLTALALTTIAVTAVVGCFKGRR
jgi:hypothetical protein